jgi:RNA polymerase sigma factor (sigma-70 family)
MNDREEASRLFRENVHLAHRDAGVKWHRGMGRRDGIERDDLVQWALAGLWHACQRFDAGRGLKFSTYASRCIHGYQLSGLRTYRTQGHTTIASAVDFYRMPAIGDAAGWRAATERDTVEGGASRCEEIARVRDAIGRLPSRDAEVVRMRMAGETLEVCAGRMALSKEGVRVVERRARRTLSRLLASLRDAG